MMKIMAPPLVYLCVLSTLLVLAINAVAPIAAFAPQPLTHRSSSLPLVGQQKRHFPSVGWTPSNSHGALIVKHHHHSMTKLQMLSFPQQGGVDALMMTESSMPSMSNSHLLIGAATIDPTTALNDAFSDLVDTPVILAVPIVVALGVVGIIVWILTSSAAPNEEEDDN